jgi:hypothetical protein
MRFSIRDILWLTILVAVAVAWWLDHRASSRNQQQLPRELFLERLYVAEKMLADIDEKTGLLTSQVRKAQLEATKAEYEDPAHPSPSDGGNESP